MKFKNILMACIALTTLFPSCDNFDELNTNPDSTTKVTSSMLATGLIMKIMSPGSGKDFLNYNMLDKHIAWGESGIQEMQYGKLGRHGFSGYPALIDCLKMVEIADEASKPAYEGFAHFFKAWRIYYITMRLGDVPYSEALKGESDAYFTPKYDTQKEVFTHILNDLEKSYNFFSNATTTLDGDIIFDGDIEQWKKVVTAFQLKVLMSLSKKTGDADIDVRGRFAKVVREGSLMTSNDDNLKLVFTAKEGQRYPFYKNETNQIGYPMISCTLIDNLKKLNDYRLFYYCAPSKAKKDINPSEYDAYMSINPSNESSVIIRQKGAGEYCGLNARYTERPEGEPSNRLGYGEQQLILAEAAVRGWISGDASAYYKEGIRANMKFVANATPDDVNYHHGRSITDEYIESYLVQPQVQLTDNIEKNVEAIILQRYLSCFMQYPWDSYFDYRRTGYPDILINPETCLNEVKTQIAQRWRYSEDEYNVNNTSVNEAVERQFGASGDINNGLMWILED